MPDGYHLHSYDDCGVEGRQPHVLMQDCYLWTFNTSDTDAGPKERSAVFSYKGIQAVYTNLDPALSYVLALTYASDHVYNRVQSVEANGIVLHPPYALPKAAATRVIVKVPSQVTREGKMTLAWKIHGEVNATVSIIELWANAPSTNGLMISSLSGLPDTLEGKALDVAFEPVPDVHLILSRSNHTGMLTTNTSKDGSFSFSRKSVELLADGGNIQVRAERDGSRGLMEFSTTNFFFGPVHYRPIPAQTEGLSRNVRLLDGNWAIGPSLSETSPKRPLNDPRWKRFRVPGQWFQQGFVVPTSNTVAVAKEFIIPSEWKGSRLMLRFDAIHAGVNYWLNGLKLGYSENLFTPVEWDVTDAARPGQTNRLDLEMKTGTVSEALSYSSAYAFHDLGGIDRSVRIFALPSVHISQLHVDAALDRQYRDGVLNVALLVAGNKRAAKLALGLKVEDPRGKVVRSEHLSGIDLLTADKALNMATKIPDVLPWSAEKPNLYRVILELREGKSLLEKIERMVGFRCIEIRERQFYVNGHKVKLAGACHHEFDPLTGRADTMRHAEKDVRLLKEANLNLIRTSHYPPTSELLDAADRLGMYVEAEAPFCWVSGALDSSSNLHATLTPTSAMLDYDHAHPSVVIWSLANESHFNSQFLASAKMCKALDPSRPTTFNHDFAGSSMSAITDIANVHYPSWPFEKALENDPRPLYFGEFFFPVCHEQTDVGLDPGLRELWGQGCAEPDSAFSRACASDFEKPPLKPGIKPGGWSAIVHSGRLVGGSIWASHDDAFYFSETNHAGYAWHHGFWGLIDCWRRPKPEWYLARHIFSPVWLLTRHVAFTAGQSSVRVPVENRYAFTDFSELNFRCELGAHKFGIKPHLAPGESGYLDMPIPKGTPVGSIVTLRVKTAAGAIPVHESKITLQAGDPAPNAAPAFDRPASGPPAWLAKEGKIIIRGNHYGMVFDSAKGQFDARDPRHTCAVISFPSLHLTRYDFGDLNGPNSLPYAVFPETATRIVERADVQEQPAGLRLTVHDRYKDFSGSSSWLIDKNGQGTVSCDYVYTGPTMDTREFGVRFALTNGCNTLKWRRWSEWGGFPRESISRTEGVAFAHRGQSFRAAQWNEPPSWPWSLDETEFGTADFRSIKYNIYEASLRNADGVGLSAHANGDAQFRAALSAGGVTACVLRRCPLGQVQVKPNDRLRDGFMVQLETGK